jgi:type 1 glutamine amidotransferase
MLDAVIIATYKEAQMKLMALCIFLAGAVLTVPGQTGKPKIQALIVTGRNTHDWRVTTPLLRKLLEDTGRFQVHVVEEFRGAGPETIAPYDVVVLNYFNEQPELRWGERAETALTNYVRDGKGMVVYHVSLAAFDGWAEFEKMCGGNLRPNYGHHSPSHDFTVDIKDTEHPITRGMASFPEAHDDLYANLKWQPEGSYHVLATAWDDHSRYPPDEKQPIPGTGRNQPMAWTVNYGNGRVFAIGLGHGPEAIRGAGFGAMLTRGTEWAASGDVTIPLPVEVK